MVTAKEITNHHTCEITKFSVTETVKVVKQLHVL